MGMEAAVQAFASSQIETKKAQVAEAQAELQKAENDLRMRGDSKPKRYVWGCCPESRDPGAQPRSVWVWSALTLRFSLATVVIFENFIPCIQK